MSESKELLEATIKGLEEKVNQLNNDLTTKKKELEDINKPEITGEMYDAIQEMVEEGISNFDFNDAENYEFEPEFDYHHKVVIGSIEMNDTSHIVESIMNEINKRFKISTSEDIK
jgi:hypothetical protein